MKNNAKFGFGILKNIEMDFNRFNQTFCDFSTKRTKWIKWPVRMSGLTHEIKKIIPGPPGNVFLKIFFFQNIPWMVLEFLYEFGSIPCTVWSGNLFERPFYNIDWIDWWCLKSILNTGIDIDYWSIQSRIK